MAATIPTFNACVGILADMIGKLPLKLYQRSNDGRREATEHPAHRLVAMAPGEMHTPFELRQLTQTGVGYGGNGYMRVYRDSFFQPAELQWLKPCDVTVECVKRPDGRRFPVYRVAGEATVLTRADVVHVRGWSLDGCKGVSPVRILRESLGLSVSQREQAGAIAKNGPRFNGYLVAPQALKKEQLDDARAEWESKQAGQGNSGRTPILHGAWDFKAVNGMSYADAEFLESRKFERSEIATLFRIPEVLLGNSDKASSWGTGIETLTNGFLTFALDPWLVNWEQALNFTLLTMEEQDAGYYFKFNRRALLAVALDAQANFLKTMREIRVYSPNECRAFLDENDLPDGQRGEDYGAPFNGSGGAPGQTRPTPEPAAA